jgi:hypothetical protein
MAGGTWNKLVGKERPGTYINFDTTETNVVGVSDRGTVIMPLLGHSYGPAEEFITITNGSPDANYSKLGYSVYEAPLLLVKEALKCAKTVIVYIPAQGANATAKVDGLDLTGKAKYGGTRGNDLSFDCEANEEEGYDVNVYLENEVVETFEGLATVGELIDAGSAWITFTGTRDAELTDFSAVSLAGGANAETTTLSMTKFLDAAEAQVWNTMAFPVDSKENSALLTAVVSKIKYLREDVGKYRKVVVADYTCDYEGVINVANSYVLSDGTALTHAQATAWVAGADAGADCVTSNTYKVVEDASDIVDLFSHAEAVAAIKAGKFFFSFNEQSEVAVEYDINSLTSYGDGKKAKSWRKNRVLRVLDSFGESCQLNFPPNKYDNDEDGWNIMEGIGKTILKLYGPKSDGGVGAIRNIDLDNDFLVDRELSSGDEVYFNVGIQPVDSAEKLFFTITTR